MEANKPGSAVVMRRASRLVTTGCLTTLLTLIMILSVAVSWLWYAAWNNGNINNDRRETALASVMQRARDISDDTAHALDVSTETDAGTLTAVIWQHTQAPIITYDESRRKFTATTAESAIYDEKSLLPGGGPVKVSRCLVFTYTRHPGTAWTPRVAEKNDEACHPGTDISALVRLTQTHLSSMPAQNLTRAAVQHSLDPTGNLQSYDVKSVVRTGDTLAISILVSSPGTTVGQCYRFIRHAHNNSQSPTPATATLSC
ncbi:hypothetical protein ACFQ6U_06335 [Streptomyces sp. NPDC056465]|uniref:hypothetical protein n=1 Tax=unclassified Streptomyces TaxID=2593676 RepID=UPI0035E158DB